MEYKVEINSLNNFKAWSGGLSTLNTVRERGGIDTLTTICEDLFSGNTPTDTQINDWLWFDTDFIYQALRGPPRGLMPCSRKSIKQTFSFFLIGSFGTCIFSLEKERTSTMNVLGDVPKNLQMIGASTTMNMLVLP